MTSSSVFVFLDDFRTDPSLLGPSSLVVLTVFLAELLVLFFALLDAAGVSVSPMTGKTFRELLFVAVVADEAF